MRTAALASSSASSTASPAPNPISRTGSRSTSARPRRGSRTRSSASSSTGASTRCPRSRPVLPGKLAYAGWYWNALTGGKGPKPSPNPGRHVGVPPPAVRRGLRLPRLRAAVRAELFDGRSLADVFLRSGASTSSPRRSTMKGSRSGRAGRRQQPGAGRGTPRKSSEAGSPRRADEGRAREGPQDGFLLLAVRVVQPAWLSDKPRYVAEHMIPQFKDVVTRYEPSIIFSDGEWDLTVGRVAQPGDARVALQRVESERPGGRHDR